MGSNSRLAAPQGVSAQPPTSSSPVESPMSGGFNPAYAPQTMNINSEPSGQFAPWLNGGAMPSFNPVQNIQPAVLNEVATMGPATVGTPQTGGPWQKPQMLPMSGGGTGIAPPAPTTPTDRSYLSNFNINELPGPPSAFGPQGAAATGFTQKCPTCGK